MFQYLQNIIFRSKMALTREKYYGICVKPAIVFSNKVYEIIQEKEIDYYHKERKVYEFIDENKDEWKISSDYVLGILEIHIMYKTIIQDQPRYISGWIYREDECRNPDAVHFIPVNNLRFHIDITKNLLQKYKGEI